VDNGYLQHFPSVFLRIRVQKKALDSHKKSITDIQGEKMKYALWIVQILLAVAFGMAGFSKLMQPITDLVAMVGPWASEVPELFVRFIGLAEILGAIGLILPALTRIQPRLTSHAAIGIAIIMVLAATFHIAREEYAIIPNIVLLALAAFVAYGRTKLEPIESRY